MSLHWQVIKAQIAQDRPYWPYSSSEERKKDEKANLPLPEVVASADGCGSVEWKLNELDVECLALGAGILGCGGGGDPNLGRIMAINLLKEGKQVKILNPCRYVRGFPSITLQPLQSQTSEKRTI